MRQSIYVLYFEHDPSTVYIGKSVNPIKRKVNHLFAMRRGDQTKLHNWLRENQEKQVLCMDIIKETYNGTLEETKYINEYKRKGYTLMNSVYNKNVLNQTNTIW